MKSKKSNTQPDNLVQSLVSRLEKLEAKVAELGGLVEKLTSRAPAAKAQEGIAPHLLAVIAAALDTVIKAPHLVHSVRELTPDESAFDSLNWSIEGRRQIFSSHRIR